MTRMYGIGTWARACALGVATAALAACGGGGESGGGQQRLTIAVDGSSTVGPLSKAVADAFNANAPLGVSVTVAESGTGGGFQKFCAGSTQVQGASRPIRAVEMGVCARNGVSYIELPVAFDALTVIVNPENPVKEITVAQLAKIWGPDAEGKDAEGNPVGERIENWRQIDRSWPDLKLSLFGAGTASGTFDYFTQAVVGTEGASRKDFFPSENDNNIITGVAGDKGAMGFLGMSYYLNNKDKVRSLAVKLDDASPAVYPSVEAVQKGEYKPLGRPLFIYVSTAALEARPVEDFVTFYLANAERISGEASYVPLPASAYEAGKARLTARAIGTAFAGHSDISGSIDEVLSRPLVTEAAPAAE